MKDALGHGSDAGAAHQEGVDSVGRRFTTLAGTIVIGHKDPSTMTNAELAKEYQRVTMHDSATTREFINAGRGMERPLDIAKLQDPLSVKDRALTARVTALHDEAESRNRMGGRRVTSDDGRVRFVGKQPGHLQRGHFEGS